MTTFKKLSQLPLLECRWIVNIQAVNGIFFPTAEKYYHVGMLQNIPETELKEKIFLDEDFIILPGAREEERVIQAKIGKLYLKYYVGAKGSFSLEVKQIDTEKKALRSFLNLNIWRYSLLRIENLMPIPFSGFDSNQTVIPQIIKSEQDKQQLSHAFEIKKIIGKLMLDQAISSEEMLSFTEHYIHLFSTFPTAKKSPTYCDVSHFVNTPQAKPCSLFEIATKITALAQQSEISAQHLIAVLMEFVQETQVKPKALSLLCVQGYILTKLPDAGLAEKIGLMLPNAIHELTTLIKSQQRNNFFQTQGDSSPPPATDYVLR